MEAIACLAAHHFYDHQPEIALRYYRRLVQAGLNTSELWNNLGLCCFQASQYDMSLTCFERALRLANDTAVADVWYNIGHVAIGIGDLGKPAPHIVGAHAAALGDTTGSASLGLVLN